MEIHPAQASILRTLRHAQSARYTDLRLPTNLESDAFKFHLSKLVSARYIRKLDSGKYGLTASGKEFANNLSKKQPSIQKQPKLSVVIIATRKFEGVTKYLIQQRRRNPYYDYWGCITGPVQWGEPIETTARREFEKQTGMTASYTLRAFYRQTDLSDEMGDLLEDKVFAVIEAADVAGDITNAWAKGFNMWMTLDELQKQEKRFASTGVFTEMLENGEYYRSQEDHYALNEY